MSGTDDDAAAYHGQERPAAALDEQQDEDMGDRSPYFNKRDAFPSTEEGGRNADDSKLSTPPPSPPRRTSDETEKRNDSKSARNRERGPEGSSGPDQSYFTSSRGPVRGRDSRPPPSSQSRNRFEPYPPEAPRAHITQSVSKVIHFRNLPNNFSLRELQEACNPYGKVLFISPIKSKNQALVEFIDAPAAIYFNDHHPSGYCFLSSARDQKVYFDFSKHRELLHKANEPNRIIFVTFQSKLSLDFISVDQVFQMFGANRYGIIEKILMVQDKKDRAKDQGSSSSSAGPEADLSDPMDIPEELSPDHRLYKSRSTLVQFATVTDAMNSVARLNGETFLIDDVGVFTMIQYSAIQSLIVPHGPDGKDFVSQRHSSPHIPPIFPIVRPFPQPSQRPYRHNPPPPPSRGFDGPPPPHHHHGHPHHP